MHAKRFLLSILAVACLASLVQAQPKPQAKAKDSAAAKAQKNAPASPAPEAKTNAEAPAKASDSTDKPQPAKTQTKASDADQEEQPDASADAPAAAKPEPKPEPRKILFQYEDADLRVVVRQFAQFVGKPLIGDMNIEGRLTFFDAEPYTTEEAWDTLNLILADRGYQLMPTSSGRQVQLVPMRDVPKRTRIVLDLQKAGKLRPGEIVTTLLPLKYIDADSASNAIVRMISSWGSVSKLPRGKGLIITDRVNEIEKIRNFLASLDVEQSGQRELKTFPLRHASSSTVAKIVESMFGGGGSRVVYNRESRRYEKTEAQPAGITINSDDRTNTLIVWGEPESLSAAQSIIQRLDTAGDITGDMKIFELKKARADELAKTLAETFSSQRIIRGERGRSRVVADPNSPKIIPDIATNRLIVSANREQMAKVEKVIQELDGLTQASGGVRIFELTSANAEDLVEVISNALSRPDQRGRRFSEVSLAADSRTNSLIVSGDAGNLQSVEELIKRLDTPAGEADREIHVVRLSNGDVRQVAGSLVRLFSKSASQPGRRSAPPASERIKVEAEPTTRSLIIAVEPGDWPLVQNILQQLEASAEGVTTTRQVKLKHAGAQELAQTLREVYGQGGSRSRYSRSQPSASTPTVITASPRTNSLLISAGPDQQQAIATLVEQLDVPAAQAADEIKMIRLEASDAQAVAQRLQNLLPPVRRGQTPDVFIDADPQTNSLLLRAPADKRQMLEDLIAQLDTETAQTARETRIVQLGNASAQAVAQTINTLIQGQAPQPSRYSRYRRSPQPSSDPDRIIVTPAPGDRAVVLDAPRSEIERIVTLIENLDTDEITFDTEVRIYRLRSSQASDVAASLTRLFTNGARTPGRRGRTQPADEAAQPQPKFEADDATNQLLVAATVEQFTKIEKTINELAKASIVVAKTETFVLRHAKAEELLPVLESILSEQPAQPRRASRWGRRPSARPVGNSGVRFAVMPSANALVVQANPEKLEIVRELIQQFDTPEIAGESIIKILPLENAKAQTVAASLQQMIPAPTRGQQPSVFIHADPLTNSILLRAPADQRKTLEEMVATLDSKTQEMTRELRVIPLKNASASALVIMLQQLYPDAISSNNTQASRWSRYRRPQQETDSSGDKITVTAAPGDRSLVVEAPKNRIEEIEKLIEQLDTEKGPGALQVRTYQLEQSNALDVARSLQRLFADQQSRGRRGQPQQPGAEPDPRFEADGQTNQLLVAATPGQFEQIEKLIENVKASMHLALETRTYKLQHARAEDLLPVLQSLVAQQAASRSRSRYGRSQSAPGQARIEAVTATNSLVIQASPEKIQLAEGLIKEFDVPEAGGDSVVQMIALENAEAESIAASLQAMIPPAPRGAEPEAYVYADKLTNSILLRAPAESRKMLEQMVAKLDAANVSVAREMRTIALKHTSASALTSMLTQLYPGSQASGRSRWGRRSSSTTDEAEKVVITAAPGDKKLVIEAPKNKIESIVSLVQELDSEQGPTDLLVRTYQLEGGNAAELARSLQRLFASQAGRPGRGPQTATTPSPRFEADTAGNQVIVAATADQFEKIEKLITQLKASTSLTVQTETFTLTHAKVDEVLPVLESVLAGTSSSRSRWSRRSATPGSDEVRLSSMSAVNAIVIQAPPAKIELARDLIGRLDIAQAAQTSVVKVIELESAKAQEVADALRAMLPRPGRGQQQEVFVHADTQTNTILLRAPADQRKDLEEMIARLDEEVQASDREMRIVELKHASAAGVAGMISELFQGQVARVNPWQRRGAPSSQDADRVIVTAAPGDRTLVIEAPAEKLEQIQSLIARVDTPDAGGQLEVRTYEVDNAAEVARSLQRVFQSPSRGRGQTAQAQPRFEADGIGKRLIAAATPAQFEQIEPLIEELQAKATVEARIKTYRLKHAQADKLAALIESMLVDEGSRRRWWEPTNPADKIRISPMVDANALVIQASPEKIALADELIAQFDTEEAADQASVQVVYLENAQADSLAQTIRESLGSSSGRGGRSQQEGQVTVTPEPNTNALLIRGPGNRVEDVVAMIRDFDQRSQPGDVQVRVFPVENSSAAQLSQTLTNMFRDLMRQMPRGSNQQRPVLAIASDDRTNSVVVTSTPAYFSIIADTIEKLDKDEKPATDVRIVRLEHADAWTVADQLSAMFYSRRTQERPTIEPDAFSNSLTIVAEQSDMRQIEMALEKLDMVDESRQVRVITLRPTVNAARLAEALKRLYGQVTDREVEIIEANRPGSPAPGGVQFVDPEPDAQQGRSEDQAPQTPAEQEEGAIVITIDRSSNSLVVSGTQKDLADLEDLIYRLTSTEMSAEATTKVYRIAKADPASVAEALDKLFNPPKQPVQRQRQRPQDRNNRRQQQQPPQAPPSKPVLTAIPDQRTRSVIVRAEPQVLELVDPIVTHLDQVSEVVAEVRVFTLTNTSAETVAQNLREVFRLSSQPSSSRGRRSPQDQRAEQFTRQLIELKTADGVSKVDTAAQVSITANTNTNSVVIAAPAEAMLLIEGLIQELDQSAVAVRAAVRLYPLWNADVASTVASLQEIFSGGASARSLRGRTSLSGQEPVIISGDETGKQIIVSASPEKHELIAQVIEKIDTAQSGDRVSVKVYAITHGDAAGIASTLSATLSSGAAGGRRRPRGSDVGSLRISSDSTSNSIVVRGSSQEHEEVAKIIAEMDVPAMADAPVQMIPLANADPTQVAQTLNRIFSQESPLSRRRGRPATSRNSVIIEADADARLLMVRSDAETFEKIRTLASKLDEATPAGLGAPAIFALENAQATTVAALVSQAFAPQRGRRVKPEDLVTAVAESNTNAVVVTASGRKLEQVKSLIKKLDAQVADKTRTEMIVLQHGDAGQIASVLSQVAAGSSGAASPQGRRGRGAQAPAGVVITAEPNANALILSGSEKDLQKLMAMALKLDQAGAQSSPVVKMYSLKNADAESVVSQLGLIFETGRPSRPRRRPGMQEQTPVTIVPDSAGGRVIVSAPAEKHELISQVISDIDEAHDGGKVEVRIYTVVNGDAPSMATALRQTLSKSPARRGAPSDPGAIRVTADRSSNAIVVRASADEHVEIARLIEQMDTAGEEMFPIQSIPLSSADPANVARILSSVYGASQAGRGRRSPGVSQKQIVIEADSDARLLLVRADAETFQKIRALAAEMDASPSGRAEPTIISVGEAPVESLAASLNQAFAPQRGQRITPGELVTVVAEPASNSLIVTANEQNLQKVRSLLESMLKEGAGTVRTEFVLLKNAKASELEPVLSRIAAASGGASSPRRGRRGASPSGQAVTISADPASNALLMSGPAGELDKLMKMALQLDSAAVSNATGAYIISLKNGLASDVAATVENLYRSQAQAARQERRSIDPLAVSADQRANAIILATTEGMYETVAKWVNELENMKPARGQMRIIPIENADPEEVQKAIEEMFPTPGGSSSSSSGRGGRTGRYRRQGGGALGAGGPVETSILEKQRAIMITASEEDYKVIAEMIRALDRAAQAVKAQSEVVALEHANNIRVAQAVNSLYGRETDPKLQVRVNALAQTNALVVAAAPDRLKEVVELIGKLDKPEVSPQVDIRIYPLENAEPEKILPLVRQMLTQVARRIPGETVDVQADTRTRSIIVTARSDVFDAVGKIIEKLDTKPAFAQAQTLVVPLVKADAPRLAAVLRQMLRPTNTNELTPEARSLQEQLRLLKLRGVVDEDLPDLDLTKPIQITPDPAQSNQQGSNSLIVTSTADNLRAMEAVIKVLDIAPIAEGVRVRILPLSNADAAGVQQILQQIFQQGERLAGRPRTSVQGRAEPESTVGKALVHPLNISADLRTNTIILSGIEESLALAEVVVKDLDAVKGKIQTQVKLFELEHVSVTKVLPMIEAVFAEQPNPALEGLRTQVTRLRTVLDEEDRKQGNVTQLPRNRPPLVLRAEPATNVMIVAARSDVMPLIADMISSIDLAGAKPENPVEFFPLTHADASRAQQVIQSLYQGRNAQAAKPEDIPTLAIDTRTNALVVSAGEKTLNAIGKILHRLDVKTPVDVRAIRLIPLENAEAGGLASTLQEMMDARVQRQQSLGVRDAESLRVIVLADPRSNSLLVGGSAESFEIVETLAKKLDAAGPALSGQIQLFPLTEADAGVLAGTLTNLFNQRYQAAATPDVRRRRPVILPDLRTNSLLVAANKDDSKVLKELLEKLDVKLTDPSVQLAVLVLSHNDAGEVAPRIEQIFADRLESKTQPGQTPSPTETVSVEVDTLTNSLIVSANKENLELIRSLLAKIDREPAGGQAQYRMIPLKNSDATRVMSLLENLLDQGMYKPAAGSVGQTPAQAWREKVALSVDTRTNVLIVSASPANLKIIEEIVGRLDTSKDYSLLGSIRIFPLERADATELAPTLQAFFRSKEQAEQQAGSTDRSLSVIITADARTNALIVAGSRESFAAVQAMIEKLDRKEVPQANTFKVVKLEQASASQLAQTIETLFAQRVTRGDADTELTVVPDPLTNSLVLGGSAEDIQTAVTLIESLDKTGPQPGQALRVFLLEKADATRTAQTIRELYQARGEQAAAGVAVSADTRTNSLIVTGGPGDLKYIADLVERLDRKEVTKVTEIRFFQLKNADATELAEILTTSLTNQTRSATEGDNPQLQTMLQFIVTTEEGKKLAASALEEGLLITPDPRTNMLVVKAHKDFMDLLARLIESLDSTDPRKAEIVVFPLENADARSMADILTQLFRLEGSAPANQAVRYTLTSGETLEAGGGEGATLGSAEQYALSITVDPRTNSLLVGGTKQYVELVGSVIRELDSSPAQQRVSKVYRLRNANPEDIETALREFLDQQRQRVLDVLGEDRIGAAERLLEREVAVVAEEASGTLLLSASPRYFKIVEEMISKLDQPPPQVLIQVLLAEVSLDDNLEIGADFNASWTDDETSVGTGTNFGVESNLNALSGMTLSVTASDLSFFFRALQSRGRMEVLSRPQIVATDNQEAEITIGQSVPFISQSSISDSGRVNNTIQYQDVGILLTVTPRINEDGFVRMEVAPEISSLSQSTVQVSENVNAIIVNRRSARTTVTVQDGHTIVIGGLITTTDENREDKVPLVGDIPLVGHLFKSTTKISQRRELLIVLTPHVLRTTAEADSVTLPQIERIRTMEERDTDKLRDAIINSLSRDPEMIKIIQEELKRRSDNSIAPVQDEQAPESEASEEDDTSDESDAVSIEEIVP